jgi:hypothetical protein
MNLTNYTNQVLIHRKLEKLTQDEIDKFNSPLTTKEIKVIIQNLLKNESLAPDGKFCQTLKEEMTSVV